jgi:segregation and condensation protein B
LEIIQWKAILESLLFAAGDEGLSKKQICAVLEVDDQKAEDILRDIETDLNANDERGIQLIELAGVYQLTTKKEHSAYLKKLLESPNTQTLSQAALETLAIIAYKQPMTRLEIEDIRGVKCERPLHTLLTKALIEEAGRTETPGRPILYSTTKEFLDYFGLKSIEELPILKEHADDEFIQEEADLFFERLQKDAK